MTPRRGAVLAVLAALITLAVYARSLGSAFVAYDDPNNFADNPYFAQLSPASLLWAWTRTHSGHYHPLTWMSLFADRLLWGMDARGYHLTSALLHSAAAALVFLCARRLFLAAAPKTAERAGEAALAAALLFALHPLRVESVSWISERRDVLSGALLLGSLLAYLRRPGETPALRLSAGLYALSLLSKASGVVLPGLLLLLDAWPLRRREPLAARLREKVPFFLLAAAGLGAALAAEAHNGALAGLGAYPLSERLATAAFGAGFYLVKTLWPSGLMPLYPTPASVSLGDAPFLASALAVAGLSVLIWRRRREAPAAAAAWAWYLIALAPVSGLARIGPQLVADRYTYLSCLSWAVLAGGALLFVRARALPAARAAAWALCALLAALSVRQQAAWADDLSLWRETAERAPCHWIAQTELGTALARRGDLAGAEDRYRRALACEPRDHNAQNNLGNVLFETGRFAEAAERYREASRLDPTREAYRIHLERALARVPRR